MIELPPVGSRVSLRHHLPPGSEKPFTDVVGHLEQVGSTVVLRTRSGEAVSVPSADIVAVRELSHVPVRASEIRALEHAAALAWPGVEQEWVGGWFLRYGHGVTSRANSALPLDMSATVADLPAVVSWYRDRGLPAWLALPERLLPVRVEGVKPTRVMVCDLSPASGTALPDHPDPEWLRIHERDVPVDVLTAVVDGAVAFARIGDAAVGRGAVTTAPDGTRWLGISAVRVEPAHRRSGHARAVCSALMDWGAGQGAQRAYVQVLTDNPAAVALYTSMGFRLHHSCRYVEAQSLIGRS
jgi:GNAT superfamily N-acetyltransferase